MSSETPAARPRPGGFAITHAEFEAFRDLIKREAGISLSPAKVQLVASRLAKRLRHFGFATYAEYYDHLHSYDPSGDEMREMINCITTNKTSFFREPHHFRFLAQAVLAAPGRCPRPLPPVRIWSAGCSTGEEPYSIAMTAADTCAEASRDVSILASDIDTAVLARAERAIYPLDAVAELPADRIKRHFLRGTSEYSGTVQVKPALREMIGFRRINLMDEPAPMGGPFDAIFCRNVIIYFDRPTQQRLIERFSRCLRPGGFLFLGHSESLYGVTELLEPLGQTVYRARPRPAAEGLRHHGVVTLGTGGLMACAQPAVLRTVLGSCVSTCLYDPVRRLGGMNHFLLPEGEGHASSTRYGAQAMPRLIARLVELGADRRRLQAKLFGGALSPHEADDGVAANVNVQFARSFLAAQGIPVVAERLGGVQGLELLFQTDTGRALVRVVGDGAKPDERRTGTAAMPGGADSTPAPGRAEDSDAGGAA